MAAAQCGLIFFWTSASVAQAAVAIQPTGGWPDVNVETPRERAARIRRERQRLGIVEPDPEPTTYAGEIVHIGRAPQPNEPIPGETKPDTTEADRRFGEQLTGTALAKAMRDAEDEAIAILLLMA